jgi:hypothetical protein
VIAALGIRGRDADQTGRDLTYRDGRTCSAAPDESNTRPCSAAIVWPLAGDAIRIDSIATLGNMKPALQ